MIRYTSALTADAQSHCDPYMTTARGSCGGYPIDPYAANFQRPSVRLVSVTPRKVPQSSLLVLPVLVFIFSLATCKSIFRLKSNTSSGILGQWLEGALLKSWWGVVIHDALCTTALYPM